MKKRLFIILLIVFTILSIPLIAMQYSNEVNWSMMDFVMAGILLFGLGLTIDFTFRNIKTKRNRILICGIVILLFFLVWAELAVGIFNSPIAGN